MRGRDRSLRTCEEVSSTCEDKCSEVTEINKHVKRKQCSIAHSLKMNTITAHWSNLINEMKILRHNTYFFSTRWLLPVSLKSEAYFFFIFFNSKSNLWPWCCIYIWPGTNSWLFFAMYGAVGVVYSTVLGLSAYFFPFFCFIGCAHACI